MGGLRKLREKSNYGVGMIGLIVVSERKGEYGVVEERWWQSRISRCQISCAKKQAETAELLHSKRDSQSIFKQGSSI